MAALSPNHRPGCARLGVARLKAFRLNVYEAIAWGSLDGQYLGSGGPGTGMLIAGASIQHVLNDQPDTLSVRMRGVTPVAGQQVGVQVGDLHDSQHTLFAGPIIETTLTTDGIATNTVHDVRAVDPTWLMQRRLVLKTYINQSASAIALDLLVTYCRSIGGAYIQAGLPVIDAISFTNEQVPACLTALCQRIGAYWYVDYGWQLHVFTSEDADAYSITDADPRTSRQHALREDLSQVVTAVIGRGGGVGAAIDLPAGEVEIPVEEGDEGQSWYSPTGGLVEINAQRVAYSGVRGTGATGAVVGTGNAPTAPPTPRPATGSSHTIGAEYRYAVTFTTAGGETVPGPLASITIRTISPVAPPGVGARSRGGGTYPPGLITPGASLMQFAIQIQYRGGAFGPLGAASGWNEWDGNDWEVNVGVRSYYTASDGSSAYYYPTLEPGGPAAPTSSVLVYRMDNAGAIALLWQYTSSDSFYNSGTGYIYQCASGYSSSSYVYPASGYGAVDLYDVPISQASGVTGRNIYRTTANGAALQLLTTIENNTADQYADRSADAALGAAPPTVDTSAINDQGQVLNGATELPVSSTTPFSADMVGGANPGGWVRAGGLVLRYTGIGAGALTGVPASGLGSITATIRYGAQVLVQPRLVGVPASGTGALLQPIRRGDTVTIRIEREDVDAINAMANRLQLPWQPDPQYEDGRIELAISDSRLGPVELAATVQATLTERKDPHRTLTFESRDPSLQVGRLVTVTITKPPISGTFRIQRITFSELAISGSRGNPYPLRAIEATNKLYTFADLLRQLRGREGGLP